MAEPQTAEGQDKRPPPQGGNGGEDLPDDVEALKKALAEERRKHGQLLNENKRIKTARDEMASGIKRWSLLDEAGYTPEQIQEIVGRQEKEQLDRARDTGEVDKLLENQRKKHEKELEQERQRAQRMFQINQKLFVDDVLNRALDKVGVEPRLKKGAFHLYREKFTVIEDPENEYGMRTVVKVGADDYMDPDEFMKNEAENNEDFSPYLKQSMATGGGAGGGSALAKLRFKARSEMSPKEKSDYIPAHGKAAYDALPWKRS